jgi:hypothetical protein
MMYIILRGRWYNNITLNVYGPCVEKGNDERHLR